MNFLSDPVLLMAIQAMSNLLFVLAMAIAIPRMVWGSIQRLNIDFVIGEQRELTD